MRPVDHQRRVAAALARLHEVAVAVDGPVPLLTDYYLGSVVPRVERRAERFGHVVGADRVARCLQLSRALCRRHERRRMLHSDLYAENVLFDRRGEPVFIDPHAKVGSPAFDWAFWCVYYVPTGGFEDRAALCREYAPTEYGEALEWAVTLAVDGALYYLDHAEDASGMLAVLNSEPLGPLLWST
jgi:streptomycin 6-kinase